MSVAVALLMIAQSATPTLADTSATNSGSQSRRQVVAQVTASATVLRPVRIEFDETVGAQVSDEQRNPNVQRSRDAAGTYWLEFS